MAKMTKLVASISAKTSGYIKALRKARKENKKLSKSYKNLKKQTKSFSRSMRSYLGIFAAGAFVKGVIDTGLAFEKMARVMKFATGSSAQSAEAISNLRGITDQLGLHFLTTADAFAKFNGVAKSSAIAGKEAEDAFLGVATAGAALGLSIDDQRGVFKALEQMMSKGTVQAEELRGQLGERLPGALPYAAKALGVTTRELNKMLEKGEVLAEDLIPKLSKVLRDELGASAVLASQQTQAALSRLSNSWDNFQNALFSSRGVIAGSKLLKVGLDGVTSSLGNEIPSLQVAVKRLKELKDAQNGVVKTLPKQNAQQSILDILDKRIAEYSKTTETLRSVGKKILRGIGAGGFFASESIDDGYELDKLKKLRSVLEETEKITKQISDKLIASQEQLKLDTADGQVGSMLDTFASKFVNNSGSDKKLEQLELWFNNFKAQLDKTDQMSQQYVADLYQGSQMYSQAKEVLLADIALAQQKSDRKMFDSQEFKMNIDSFKNTFKSAMAEVRDDMKITNGKIKEGFEKTVESMSDGIVEFAVNGKAAFKDFVHSALIDLAKLALKRALIGFLGGFSNGGAFEGGVQAFAKGGVVSSPTMFPMANGAGLMGEAGPEAIMPLSRDSSGALGVKADLSSLSGGGGTVINQTIQVDATNSDISQEKLEEAVKRGAYGGFQLVVDDINRGGAIPQLQGA